MATDGATRISSAAVNSSIANKHLPELTAAMVKAGSSHAATLQSSVNNSRESVVEQQRRGAGGVVVSAEPEQQFHHQPIAQSQSSSVGSDEIMMGQQPPTDQSAADRVAKKDVPTKETSEKVSTEDPASSTKNTNDSEPSKTNNAEDATVIPSDIHDELAKSYDDEHRTHHLPEGSAVPSSRISRAFGFASLGAGLAIGTVTELAKRTLGASQSTDPIVLSNDANAQRLSASLRRMRGAAMKLGQMLSIQDESIAPPALTNALAQVRKGAEAMPQDQLMQQLNGQWGDATEWKEKIELEDRPFAAASIGQVHRGKLMESSPSSGLKAGTKVAVKVQYPGVADSIESDLSNLSMLVKATGLAPPGLFLENVIRVGRDELKVECDYQREVVHQKRFQTLIASDPSLVADRFVVPAVIEELSTDRILVTELVHGGTIDKVVNLDQSERNRIGRAIMRLTILELFVWRFMVRLDL